MELNHKKLMVIILMALLFSIFSYTQAISISSTNATNATGNQTLEQVRLLDNNVNGDINFTTAATGIQQGNTRYISFEDFGIQFNWGSGYFNLLNTGFSTGSQIESLVNDGTRPFIITSTTMNTNLNADMVDGLHASALGSAYNDSWINNTFLPLSGGTMTGSINMSDGYNNISKLSYINNSNTLSITKTGTGAAPTIELVNQDTTTINAFKFRGYGVSTTINQFNVEASYGGNLTSPKFLPTATSIVLFRMNAAGYYNSSGLSVLSGSQGTFRFIKMANDDWNTTSRPLKIDIQNTLKGSTSLQTVFSNYNNLTAIETGNFSINSLSGSGITLATIDSAGQITRLNFSGSGNAYLCLNSSGYPYRGSPGC